MPKTKRGMLIAASLTMILMGAVAVLTGALLPVIVDDLALQPAQAGLLVSVPAIGYIVAATLAGVVGDAWGFRRVWLLGICTSIVALVGVALTPSFGWLLPAVAAVGLVGGFSDVAIAALVGTLSAERSGSALNRVYLFFAVGASTAPFMVGLALRWNIPWRWQYAALALPSMAILLLLLRTHVRQPAGETAPVRSPQVRRGFNRQLLASPRILVIVLVMALYTGVEGSMFSWVAYYLVHARDLMAATASLGVSLFWVGIVAGRFLCGQLAERMGYGSVVIGGGLIGAVGIALLLLLPGQWLPWAGVLLTGLAFGGIYATILATALAHAQGRVGAVTGLVSSGGGVGKIITPWLVGLVIDGFNLPAGMSLIAGLAALMALLYAWGMQAQITGRAHPPSNELSGYHRGKYTNVH